MARARRQSKPRAKRTPAERSKRFEGNRLTSPTIEWSSPPNQVRLPSASDLKGMPPEQLSKILKQFGISKPWPQMKMATAAYAERMMTIPPGNPGALQDEIKRLLDFESKRGALGAARRAYREYAMIEAMDGDVQTDLIWISDGDDGTCERCAARGGDIGTVQYHAAQGLPGPSVCQGGDYCRCQLLPID